MTEHTVPVVAVVSFPLTGGGDPESQRRILEAAGPEYTTIPGLRRKYFLIGDGVAGGVYEWESRARAEQFFDSSWYRRMTENYGARPDVRLFDSPAIADGIARELTIYLPPG